MKVVVTGGAGFMGSHLVERLVADGHAVTVLDDLSTGSLAHLSAVRGRAVLHTFDCASEALPELLAKEQPDVLCVLTPGLEAGVRALTSAGAARVVLLTSSAVYGETTGPVSERVVPRPSSREGAVAVSLEAHLAALCAGVALRVGAVYGPRGRGPVAGLVRAAAVGRPGVVGPGALDLVHVDDVVDAVVRCLGGRADGRRLNIGSGTLTPLREVQSRLAALTGVADAPDYGPPLPVTPALENGAARRALGWEPAVSLDSGLARYLDVQRESPSTRAG